MTEEQARQAVLEARTKWQAAVGLCEECESVLLEAQEEAETAEMFLELAQKEYDAAREALLTVLWTDPGLLSK